MPLMVGDAGEKPLWIQDEGTYLLKCIDVQSGNIGGTPYYNLVLEDPRTGERVEDKIFRTVKSVSYAAAALRCFGFTVDQMRVFDLEDDYAGRQFIGHEGICELIRKPGKDGRTYISVKAYCRAGTPVCIKPKQSSDGELPF